jgi:hypothetical protein
MSRRGAPTGPNLARFETDSRRQPLAAGRADRTITAMTYLRASKITVATKAQLMRALKRRGK